MLKVTFRTNRSATARLSYRLVGTDDWLIQELPWAQKHRAEVVLLPEAKAEWLILAGDEHGRVAFEKQESE